VAVEWWCPRCRVTHPPGRKVCVHCGGRTQTSREAGPILQPGAIVSVPGAAGEAADAGDEADVPESRGARTARLGMTLGWVALAVLATVLRMCQERG
jgi:hypothetical protein